MASLFRSLWVVPSGTSDADIRVYNIYSAGVLVGVILTALLSIALSKSFIVLCKVAAIALLLCAGTMLAGLVDDFRAGGRQPPRVYILLPLPAFLWIFAAALILWQDGHAVQDNMIGIAKDSDNVMNAELLTPEATV